MLPHIEEDVPEFLLERNTVAYCSQLNVKRIKSSLVLARNLKFYEFRRKELLHQFDLRSTYLLQLSSQLQAYRGPISSFLIREDVAETSGDSTSYSMLQAVEELPLSLGKFIWLGEQIYVLLRCWQTLLVLHRPQELGASFELIAQHENVQNYSLVRGPIKYQAYVELQFSNGKRLRTNFQPPDMANLGKKALIDATGLQRLLQRVHGARAELHTQRAQTQQDFERAHELQAFGIPGQRSPLLEEKQLLRRCGDVWTRICGDFLVLGTLLNNSAGVHRPNVLHALRPLLQVPQGSGLNYVHRLYELPLAGDGQPPEDFAELSQFWSCHRSNSLSWCPVTSGSQLSPERSAVLLVRLPLADLLCLERLELLAIYELLDMDSTKRHLQLQLASINVIGLLQQWELHVPSFAQHTLHQDFLAVIMTQSAHCALMLQFQSQEQLRQFEELLQNKLNFTTTTTVHQEQLEQQGQKQQQQVSQLLLDDISMPQDFGFARNRRNSISSSSSSSNNKNHNSDTVFYNPQSQLLLLHSESKELWHIYARSQTELCLLLRRIMRDLLQLHCNLSLLQLHEDACSVPSNASLLLESAMRDELQARAESLELPANASRLRRLHQLEMASDLLLTVINSQNQLETL